MGVNLKSDLILHGSSEGRIGSQNYDAKQFARANVGFIAPFRGISGG